MRAFITSGLLDDSLATENLYRDTLDFLEEGRKVWENVSRKERGTVFDDSFIRGIRVLHLEAFTKVRTRRILVFISSTNRINASRA